MFQRVPLDTENRVSEGATLILVTASQSTVYIRGYHPLLLGTVFQDGVTSDNVFQTASPLILGTVFQSTVYMRGHHPLLPGTVFQEVVTSDACTVSRRVSPLDTEWCASKGVTP